MITMKLNPLAQVIVIYTPQVQMGIRQQVIEIPQNC